jgi:hypothetical protein
MLNRTSVQVVVEYLKARAAAEARGMDCYPESLMLTRAAEVITELSAELASAKERTRRLQLQVSEFECREGGL